MVKSYIFREWEDKCFVIDREEKKKANQVKELDLLIDNNFSFQWKYKHNDSILIIEKLGDNIFTATLKNVNKDLGTIKGWIPMDYGQAVYNEEKGGYVLEYGLSKIFHLFINNYNKNEPWEFNFNYDWHLVLKDKDRKKPYYWYYWDYTEELSNFVYQTLSPHIKPEQGQIVALPAELGDSVEEWSNNNYFVNYFYYGFDKENKGYDFYTETYENWIKNNGKPALIITFLPTYFKNYELGKGQKLTGTTWIKKIWEVFGAKGVPIVVKCYQGFVHVNLYSLYSEIYNQISSITNLPTSINQREVGGSNLLVFFNCPWMEKKTPYITSIT